MRFAFTEDQDLLRREARSVLANGGWGRDDLAGLGFLATLAMLLLDLPQSL